EESATSRCVGGAAGLVVGGERALGQSASHRHEWARSRLRLGTRLSASGRGRSGQCQLLVSAGGAQNTNRPTVLGMEGNRGGPFGGTVSCLVSALEGR